MSSSTSVTLRTHRVLVAEVAQPALQDVEGQVDLGVTEVGGVVRGDPAGVERHDRAGLEGDDLAGAPCRRAGSRGRSGCSGPSPVSRTACVHLVADVHGDEHGGERLDRRRPGTGCRRRCHAAPRCGRPGRPWRPWPRRGPSRPERRLGCGVLELLHLASGQVVERGGDQGVGQGGLDRARPSSPGAASSARNSRPSLTRALAIETTTLPASAAGKGDDRGDEPRPTGCPRRPDSAAAASSLDAPLIARSRSRHESTSPEATPAAHARIAGSDHDPVTGGGEADGQAAARGPVPPRIPMRTALPLHTPHGARTGARLPCARAWDSSRESGSSSPACSPTRRWRSLWHVLRRTRGPRWCCRERGEDCP